MNHCFTAPPGISQEVPTSMIQSLTHWCLITSQKCYVCREHDTYEQRFSIEFSAVMFFGSSLLRPQAFCPECFFLFNHPELKIPSCFTTIYKTHPKVSLAFYCVFNWIGHSMRPFLISISSSSRQLMFTHDLTNRIWCCRPPHLLRTGWFGFVLYLGPSTSGQRNSRPSGMYHVGIWIQKMYKHF